MNTCRRKKIVIDQKIQFGLASRLFTYWCATWLAVFAIPFLTQIFMSGVSFAELTDRMVRELWFPITMSILMLPIVARDCLRFSHRIAGPIWRINRTLRDINDGEPVEKMKLRKNDYCQDLADEVNRMIGKNCPNTTSEVDDRDHTLFLATNETAAS